MNQAFFLDRDGTINVDHGYIHETSDLELLEGAAYAIRRMNENDYKVIVVTNQSGVARGYFPYSDVDKINQHLQKLLREQGAFVDHFYTCPHHPRGIVKPYNIVCACRKPGLLLYKQAQKDYEIDMGKSYAVGDRLSDIQYLNQLGIKKTGLIGECPGDGYYESLLAFTDAVFREKDNEN
ncbi:HAD family hydrolase [Lachnospiraceae bacterium 47-T17]